MSDSSVLHIKQELDISTSCCSPSTSTTLGVNRSNSYSNGTSGSTSSTTSSGSIASGGGTGGNTSTSGNKSSPSVSPERQLCSSTTALSADLHSVTLTGCEASIPITLKETDCGGDNGNSITNSSNSMNGGGVTTGGSIRDELRRLCLVCGDVASGFHYGVASCEACKAFFKRTIQGNIEYTCPANNECEINKRRRKACQACRFQKCLLMGMLKEGVRLDRVRGGRQKYRRNPVSNSYQTMQLLYQSNSTSLEDIKVLEILNAYEPDTLTVQQLPQQPHTTTDGKVTQNRLIKLEHSNCGSGASNNSSNSEILSSSLAAPTSQPICIFQNNNCDTGEVLAMLSDLYDKELVSVIGWAKQLPGFTELPLNDQMKLLQVSWAEILTLQLSFRSLPFNGRLCFATDVWMDELLAKECGFAEFYYHCVQIAQRLERLSPRREEYYLLKALILSNCDILLDDQSSLRAFRESILNSLNDVVCLLRYGSAVSHQQQLLLLLPALRQADGILRRFWRDICHEGKITVKKLFVEMLEPVSR
ncbi:steroid hormone receptor ERR2 [Anastrepha ludens]|uniref:steroid hormone receptor ERR2 n=1 Tax=Anastrepha ludens TaxID=28586 RepID=UPI0023B1044B|nr:steroid hormone receptor ERR2 [Anastrepha ludens]